MEKIKLALITPRLTYGGIEQQITLLAKRLDKDKFNVKVYCIYEMGPLAKELATEDIEVVHVRNIFIHNILRSLWNILRLIRSKWKGGNLKQRQIHQVGINRRKTGLRTLLRKLIRLTEDAFAFINLVICFKRERPQLAHGYNYPSKIGLLAAMICNVYGIIYTEAGISKDLHTPFEKKILRLLSPFFDKIIAMSEAIRYSLAKWERIPLDKIQVIPTMIDIHGTLRHHNLRINRENPKVGCIARLRSEKGHKFLLEAAQTVLKAFPETRFIIAGDGPQRIDLENYARTLGIWKEVEFLGSFENLASIMEPLDIFVLPSLTEGLPVTILEAMKFQKPIIASNVGGIPEEVIHGVTGILVPPENPQALADAICNLLSDRDLARKMGIAGRKRVEEEFNIDVIVKKIENLYENLCR